MDFPRRKRNRLPHYDYGNSGAYFITICTNHREPLFGDLVGADSISARVEDAASDAESSRMTDTISARMIETVFLETLCQYPDVECPKYVIMPNHLHAIIIIHENGGDVNGDDMESRADIESAPTATIPNIIQSFKRRSTIEYIKLANKGLAPPFYKKVWQRSYYDRIIRDEREYRQIWRYIGDNPQNWHDDPERI